MHKLFGTTAVIEETRSNNSGYLFMKRRGIVSLFFSCLLVYFIGSLLSGFLLSIPTYFSISGSEEFANLISNPDSLSDEAILEAINTSLPTWLNAASLFATVGMIIAVFYYCSKFEGRRIFTLGFVKKGAVSEYIVGLFIGIFMFALSYGIIVLSGEFELPKFNGGVNAWMILLFFGGFLVQGLSEEVLVRGYLFVSCGARKDVPSAVIISSLFFAFLHYGNIGINIIGFINLFLFGVFASLYFLRRGSIWGISAIHSMWNFAQGNVFGCAVSGNSGMDSIFATSSQGTLTLFNGGQFGPEGGLGVTIVLVLAIILLLPTKNKRIEIPLRKFGSEFYSA